MAYTPTTWTDGVTTLGPTNLNHLELGVQAAASTADAAIPKPASPASNDGLVWNGSSWVNAKIADANIATSAAIALSKLADPGSGNVVTSTGSGAIAAKPPGYVFAYNEFTAPVSITATTEATATTVVTASAVTFDGGTTVVIEFYSPDVTPDVTVAGRRIILALFDGSMSLGFLSVGPYAQSTQPADLALTARRRLTPAAATKTYSVRAFVSAGTGTVSGGAGGTGAQMPGFIRIFKDA